MNAVLFLQDVFAVLNLYNLVFVAIHRYSMTPRASLYLWPSLIHKVSRKCDDRRWGGWIHWLFLNILNYSPVLSVVVCFVFSTDMYLIKVTTMHPLVIPNTWSLSFKGLLYPGPYSVNCLAVNGTVTSLPVLIQNILNCVLRPTRLLQVWNYMGVSD